MPKQGCGRSFDPKSHILLSDQEITKKMQNIIEHQTLKSKIQKLAENSMPKMK